MSNIITILIKDDHGNTVSISKFSKKKAQYITDTNQWNDVMNTVLTDAKQQDEQADTSED
jgi:formyltetrahydrofolate hydrolase